jgi:hypothetical protein
MHVLHISIIVQYLFQYSMTLVHSIKINRVFLQNNIQVFTLLSATNPLTHAAKSIISALRLIKITPHIHPAEQYTIFAGEFVCARSHPGKQ